MGMGIQGIERREICWQIRIDYLENLLRALQIFEAVSAKLPRVYFSGKVVTDQLGSGLRDQDLPPVGDGPEPGTAVYCVSVVIVVT